MNHERANYIFEGTMVAEQPLATCSAALNESNGGKGKPLPVPSVTTPKGIRLMFPATGIRGKLRRALRDILRAKLIEKRVTRNHSLSTSTTCLPLAASKGAARQTAARWLWTQNGVTEMSC